MSFTHLVKGLLSQPLVRGMRKAVDITGAYDARSGRMRDNVRNADDLRTPTVRDDVRHMRGDFNQVGGDMRRALKKYPSKG
jgi:hypothetical protein